MNLLHCSPLNLIKLINYPILFVILCIIIISVFLIEIQCISLNDTVYLNDFNTLKFPSLFLVKVSRIDYRVYYFFLLNESCMYLLQ